MMGTTHGVLERVRRFALPEGVVACRGTWLRQVGEMRFGPDSRWLPFEAEQWFEGHDIDFRWQAKVRMAPLVSAEVVDAFKNGAGTLTARVFGVIPLARARGPETDRGEALRGLSELPWRPFGFGEGPSIIWEATKSDGLRASFDDGRTRAVLEFEVDAEGRVLGGRTSSRPRLVDKSVVDTPWSGVFGEYRMFDGLRVPTAAEVTWHLPEGLFTYWRGRVIEFRVLR
ncbi:MAG TPA: DUF6544 family protein [Anaeromyxobacteraceae bacterium]|nr:DUF6544 family protein [Anaeromyxobacteraceae bacterium]